jgi:hypothetical protein
MPYRLQRDGAVAWMLAVLPIPTGLIISLLNERFTSHSWRFAGGMPGGYPVWGGVLLVLGAAMVVTLALRHVYSSRRLTGLFIGALAGIGVWWIALGGLFFYTALQDPLANPLGAVVWLWIGGLYFCWGHYERQGL